MVSLGTAWYGEVRFRCGFLWRVDMKLLVSLMLLLFVGCRNNPVVSPAPRDSDIDLTHEAVIAVGAKEFYWQGVLRNNASAIAYVEVRVILYDNTSDYTELFTSKKRMYIAPYGVANFVYREHKFTLPDEWVWDMRRKVVVIDTEGGD